MKVRLLHCNYYQLACLYTEQTFEVACCPSQQVNSFESYITFLVKSLSRMQDDQPFFSGHKENAIVRFETQKIKGKQTLIIQIVDSHTLQHYEQCIDLKYLEQHFNLFAFFENPQELYQYFRGQFDMINVTPEHGLTFTLEINKALGKTKEITIETVRAGVREVEELKEKMKSMKLNYQNLLLQKEAVILEQQQRIKALQQRLKSPNKPAKKVQKGLAAAVQLPKPPVLDKPQPIPYYPESAWSIDEFKYHFCNHEDKHKAMEQLWHKFDAKGWSFWKVTYIKYEGEGEKSWLTKNMMMGNLQQLEPLKKYAMARVGVYGWEGDYEIIGIYLWRGTIIPQEWTNLPSYEYHQFTPLKVNEEGDRNLIMEYWLSDKEGDLVEGRPMFCSKWLT